jgi:hypothetical protein
MELLHKVLDQEEDLIVIEVEKEDTEGVMVMATEADFNKTEADFSKTEADFNKKEAEDHNIKEEVVVIE